MNINTILIVLGEPNSTFSEILFKYFKSSDFKNLKKKIILIGCKELLEKQMMKLKFNYSFKQIKQIQHSKKGIINIINIDYKYDNIFSKINKKSNSYIKKCFKVSLEILKKNKNACLINGPISKKFFLNNKFPGITEYLANLTNSPKKVMLIYNDNISVSPLTTHIPIKYVAKNITKKKIIENIILINKFYLNKINKKPLIGVLGLNPHCETTDKKSEEKKIIVPAINFLKGKKIKINGPFSADTFFLKKNIKKYDVVLGMYHDQVLTPIKTLYNFNAINLTLGLPFMRVSPDHGPNSVMLGKNKSDPSSIFFAMKFFNNLK